MITSHLEIYPCIAKVCYGRKYYKGYGVKWCTESHWKIKTPRPLQMIESESRSMYHTVTLVYIHFFHECSFNSY